MTFHCVLDSFLNISGDKKQHEKLAKRMPGVHSPQPSPQPGRLCAGQGGADNSSISSLPVSESEDDLNGEFRHLSLTVASDTDIVGRF